MGAGATSAEGVGFAIPINKARRVMHDLMSAGRVAPLWLGLDLQDVDGRTAMALGLRDAGGVLVTAVFPGSPAAKAGIVTGDIVESINTSPVRDRRDYLDILRNQTTGTSLRLQVLREGGPVKLEATPEPFSDADARALLERLRGSIIPPAFARHPDIVRNKNSVRAGRPAKARRPMVYSRKPVSRDQ